MKNTNAICYSYIQLHTVHVQLLIMPMFCLAFQDGHADKLMSTGADFLGAVDATAPYKWAHWVRRTRRVGLTVILKNSLLVLFNFTFFCSKSSQLPL